MEILEYFSCAEQEYWREEIGKSEWRAGQYLYSLLSADSLRNLCGQGTRVLMLTEGKHLLSFCTYAPQDDIPETLLTPWIGFVYTFPGCRGHRHMGKLIAYAEQLAEEEGHSCVYISTGETGLYEKYGYALFTFLKDVNGKDSRIYRKILAKNNGICKIAINHPPIGLILYF